MKKIIYAALIMILVGAIGGIIVFNTSDQFHPIKAHAQTKTASVHGVKEISVDTSSIDVQIVKTKSDKLSAEVNGWGNKQMLQNIEFTMKREGNVLHLSASKEERYFMVTFGWTKLVVKVPDKEYDRITVDAGSGDLSVENLRAGHLSLTSGSGEISAKNNKSTGNFIVQTTSGDIDMQHNQARNEANVSANGGELTLSDLTAKSSRLETTSGDIDVQRFSGSLIAQANSGEIEIKSNQLSGDIDAEATSGDIDIDFVQEPDSLSVDYRGGSGEGTVDLKGFLYKEKSESVIIGKKGEGKYKIKARTNSGDFTLK
ncbi:DUF4097 family beta strand repeat-containing protein [Sporolactobacillus laevolacticus]|uniref:DUF4097 domain-containing protein n=1 Tax=Sporolactobacillus laevolacticus DSM 442 TaxID=1395513 RepID=V6IW45_9BACL|nr:DUF4097 family beta strand repeat-containing protein [Sporolactobacillus laevolacticus]EST11503.1 hypothetical protein P343_11875 [Sporolactobacillus laevolacticus DSM 442]